LGFESRAQRRSNGARLELYLLWRGWCFLCGLFGLL
jgi:hypothetical protein